MRSGMTNTINPEETVFEENPVYANEYDCRECGFGTFFFKDSKRFKFCPMCGRRIEEYIDNE